ncbi:MAG: hypothetical protein E3J56_00330 [Candidatus Aminicenantes bacterium]|nr:MAG: hypothetical protein E3J56_00330 [Candidatus Aminicenantes bacterium]
MIGLAVSKTRGISPARKSSSDTGFALLSIWRGTMPAQPSSRFSPTPSLIIISVLEEKLAFVPFKQ